MRAAVEELCGKLDGPSIGYKFRHFKRRNVGGRMIDSSAVGKHAYRWQVCDLRTDRSSNHSADPSSPLHGVPTGVVDGGHLGDVPGRNTSPLVWEDAGRFRNLLEQTGRPWSDVVHWLNLTWSAGLPVDAGFDNVLTDHRKAARKGIVPGTRLKLGTSSTPSSANAASVS